MWAEQPLRAMAWNRGGAVKGIVFNLLQQVVEEDHGEDTWDSVLEDAGVDGAYTAVGSYEDSELFAIVGALSQALDRPAHDLVRWFGTRALPLFRERFPAFFTDHTSTLPFLLTLNDIIHPEVRKLFPGADVPVFDFNVTGQDQLSIGYRSHRRMCAFAEGLIQGAAAEFGERVLIEQPTCMHRGDPECTIVCSFESDAAT